MIRKLKKFGKHCTAEMQQEGSGGGGKLFFKGLLGMLDNLEIDYFCVLLNFYVTKFFQAFIAKSNKLPNFLCLSFFWEQHSVLCPRRMSTWIPHQTEQDFR